MGLLDDILKSQFGGKASTSEPSSLVKALLDLLDEPDVGGVGGLQKTFQDRGLGDAVRSWIGTGPNQSIAPDQLASVLGKSRVDQLAQRSGVSASEVTTVLASVLPALVDRLTPDGQVPPREVEKQRGASLLEGLRAKFGGGSAPAPRGPVDFSDVKAGSSSTAAAPPPAEEIYTVVAGDSLSKIAKRYYGNASEWRRIYDANRDVIGANPDLIRPGQKLRIPKQ